MPRQLTAEDARQSLTAHVEQKGVEVFVKYGPQPDWAALQGMLADRAYVRYPCTIAFDAAGLQPGEFAHPVQDGATPEEGFTMYVHPAFSTQMNLVVSAVLYQLVALNYGEFAAAEDAETFGAAALGLTRDEYYAILCAMSEAVGGGVVDAAMPPSAGDSEDHPHGCGGGCTCNREC